VTPHTLRHTCGRNMVDAGTSLDRVASLLGHESVDTTRITLPPPSRTHSRRWIVTRCPEMYESLTVPTGLEQDTPTVRFDKKGV